MKIAHILPALTKGGAERVACDLANHAVRLGHNVTVIAGWSDDPSLQRNSLDTNISVEYVSKRDRACLSAYGGIFSWVWSRRRWLQEQDILHCHLTYGSVFGCIAGLVGNVIGGKPPAIIETYHAVGMPIRSFDRWVHARLAARRDALALMAEDDYWRTFINTHPKLLSRVIPNGIAMPVCSPDTSIRHAYRRVLGITDDCEFVVGAVGMLRPERQPWLYLPIFAEMARVLGPRVHFVLAGGGKELERMRSLVVEHRLEGRVHLPGMVLQPALPMSVIDLYLTLNVGPNTGLSAMEAAWAGIPVVAIQLLPYYKAGPADWIWSDSDLAAVAVEGIRLLGSPMEREALGARQKAYVASHHTVDAMADAYYSLYRSALNGNCSGSADRDTKP